MMDQTKFLGERTYMLFRTPIKRANNANKQLKFINWLAWLEKIFTRKKILIDTDSCAYGKTHLVSKAKKIGGGWMFYSLSCSGCPLSKEEMSRFRLYKKVSPMAPSCALLKSPLFYPKEVKDNEEVELELYTITDVAEQNAIQKQWVDNVMIPVPPLYIEGHDMPLVPVYEEEEHYDDDDGGDEEE